MSDPANRVNEVLRALYERRCQEAARDFPVVLHLEDTSLVLIDGQERFAAPNRFRAQYDLLKNVSHLPLAVFLTLDGDRERETLAVELPAVVAQVTESGLAEADQVVQFRLLKRTREFLDSPGEMGAYVASVIEDVQYNIGRAVELRVEGMHEQLGEWAKRLGARWRELRVVIATSHMARRENLPERYFQWLLGEDSAHRIFKAEGLAEEPAALGVLGVHLVDSEIGRAFFGAAEHMHRDLLSPPLPAVLAKLTPIAQ